MLGACPVANSWPLPSPAWAWRGQASRRRLWRPWQGQALPWAPWLCVSGLRLLGGLLRRGFGRRRRLGLGGGRRLGALALGRLALGRLGGLRRAVALGKVVFAQEIVARHVLVGDLGEPEDQVDHLLLIDRRAQARLGVRALAQLVEHLLLAAAIAHGLGPHRLGELVVRDRDVVLAADLGQHQAQPHPPLGDLAIFALQLVLALALVLRRDRRPRPGRPGPGARSPRTRPRPSAAAARSRGRCRARPAARA